VLFQAIHHIIGGSVAFLFRQFFMKSAQAAPAAKREAEEDWGDKRRRRR
jgi:hypothetical protein